MAEGVLSAAGAVTEEQATGKGSRKPPEPDPDPERAPRGWRWDPPQQRWVPRLSPGRKKKNREPDNAIPDTAAEGRDPAPGWMRDEQTDPPDGKLAFGEVPQQVKDDIAGLAGLVGIPILSLLQQVDPYCGGAFLASYEPIVDAALPLICRSSKIVRYFSEDKSDWLLWGKLALALKPVGQAILQHHVFRTVEVVRDETGIVRIVERKRGHDDDHLTPPVQPEFSYAA